MAEFKFSCPLCGQHIQCDTSYSGAQINCPTCQQTIVVPSAMPVPPPAPIAYSTRQAAAAPAAGRPFSGAATARQPVPAKSRTLQNVLVITMVLLVLAGLGVGGWYGYTKYKLRKFPPGLVGLWLGDGNGSDSAGKNKMELTDIAFAEGKVGQAFSFNGTSSYFKIPDSPALDVGEGKGLTISAWIKPSDVNGLHPILEWQPGQKMPGLLGIQFWIGQNPGSRGVLCGFFMDKNGNNYVQIPSPRGTLAANTWQHIALTYSQDNGILALYVNGKLVSQHIWGNFVPLTKGDISSFRAGGNPGDWTYNRFFAGLMDELAIYNRALSLEEIEAISGEQQ